MAEPKISPIFKNSLGQWFFWDEIWANTMGPYDSEEIAKQKLVAYSHWLKTGEMKE